MSSYSCAVTLATLAIIRYLNIAHYHHFLYYVTRKNVAITVVIGWMIAIMCTIPAVVGFWGKLGYDRYYGLCAPSFGPTMDINHITYSVVVIGTFSCIINIITTICYAKIYRCLRLIKLKKNCHLTNNGHRQTLSIAINDKISSHYIPWAQREINITFTMFIIFMGYMITYGPTAIVIILQVADVVQANALRSCILFTFMSCNSVINPFVLITSSRIYRSYLMTKLQSYLPSCYLLFRRRVAIKVTTPTHTQIQRMKQFTT